MKFAASKWQIAALTLVTLPAAIWFVAENPDFPISKLPLFLGLSPLYIGAGMELCSQWKAVLGKLSNPESHVEGGPTGNKGFIILSVTLVGLVVFLACIGAAHRT